MRQMTDENETEAPADVWLVWPYVAGARSHMQGLWQSWENDPAVWVPVSLVHLLDQTVSQVSGSQTLQIA